MIGRPGGFMFDSLITMLPTPLSQWGDNAHASVKMADIANTAQLVELWKNTKRSVQTRRSYDYDIRCFIAFLLGDKPNQVRLNDIDLRTVTINDVQAFADHLEVKELAVTTRHRRLAAVRSLLRFGHKIGYLQFNAAADTPLPEPEDTLAERILSELQVMTIVALTPPGRDRLLIQTLYYSGARVSELAGLTWKRVQPNRDGHGQITLYGKGQKTRTVIIPKEVYEGLLSIRISKSPDAAVFASRKGGKPLKARQIEEIVTKAGERAGIKGVSPHWLRHSHASHSLDRGSPVQLLQATLGHSSLKQTSRYAHARPNDSSGLYLAR